MKWIDELPNDVPTNYPRKWHALRGKVRDLYNGEDRILQVTLQDKREADLAKSSIYSESGKIKKSDPTFDTRTFCRVNTKGVDLYVLKL